MKIWCLFSIDNEYDQPPNNLVCWWQKKPSIETLAKTLEVELGGSDELTVKLVNIWTGKEARFVNTDYRLEEVEEGKTLE